MKVAVIGAGITGLTHAWSLKKKGFQVTVIEKEKRAGGWIQTKREGDYLFERGPRSCRAKGNGSATLKLVEDLGLQDEVIVADKASKKRYLYLEGKLRQVPGGPLGLFTSPMMKGVPAALWRERKVPAGRELDETIENFFTRRLGSHFTRSFIDPLITGIYAGDIATLSMKSCLPTLFEWEREAGSLIKGAFCSKKKRESVSPFVREVQKAGLFSFKNGMETLTDKLVDCLDGDILLGKAVTKITGDAQGVSLTVDGEELAFDRVVAAVPLDTMATLVGMEKPSAIHWASMAVVNLGYREGSITPPGFGYLVPSKEKQQILGCVWNSSVFPQQQKGGTALTVMIGGDHRKDFESLDAEKCKELALSSLQDHMSIEAEPEVTDIFFAKAAIPQYHIGHAQVVDTVRQKFPYLQLLGSSYDGIAVNDCIATSF